MPPPLLNMQWEQKRSNLFLCFIAWWIALWIKLHIRWNGLKRDKTAEKLNLIIHLILGCYTQMFLRTCLDMKQDNGPISVNSPTLENMKISQTVSTIQIVITTGQPNDICYLTKIAPVPKSNITIIFLASI